ncbi:copine-9-like [Argonauta hians]
MIELFDVLSSGTGNGVNKRPLETMIVKWKISCRNLFGRKREKPNTICRFLDDYSYLVEHTDMVPACQNPEYTKCITMNYFKDVPVSFQISIYEMETPEQRTGKESIAFIKDKLGPYVQNERTVITKSLLKQTNASIKIEVEMKSIKMEYDVHIRMRGVNILKNQPDVCPKAGLYHLPKKRMVMIAGSKRIPQDEDKRQLITVPEGYFNNQNIWNLLHFKFYRKKKKFLWWRRQYYIGGFETHWECLMSQKKFEMTRNTTKVSGEVFIDRLRCVPRVDYPELTRRIIPTDVMVAVDFIKSREEFLQLNENKKTFYVSAISAMTPLVDKCSNVNGIISYGFSGKLKGQYHEYFPLINELPISIIIIGMEDAHSEHYRRCEENYTNERCSPFKFFSLTDYFEGDNDLSTIKDKELIKAISSKIIDHRFDFLERRKIVTYLEDNSIVLPGKLSRRVSTIKLPDVSGVSPNSSIFYSATKLMTQKLKANSEEGLNDCSP